MINEVSQGNGASEYVEFVVIGNPVCEGEPIPCIDLRKVIIDDNNGFFAPGTGTGIASGALRFSNDPFWSCVPQGTFIVVYNEVSPNSSLPPDDASLTDGNCTIILPGNSPLLEATSISPNTGDPLYPTADSDWVPSGGWAGVSMNNSNDSFQIPNLGVNGTPLHSVSWGNNTNGAIIFFAGPASGQVISFKNTVDNNFNDQQNWAIEDVATGETPGAANNTANDVWIGTMNPTCRLTSALIFLVINSDCGSSNGGLTVDVTNPSTNLDFLWETGATTAGITNLAPGTYTVTVTDNITGCIMIDSAVVALNNSTLAMNPVVLDESCSNACDGSVNLGITGGQTPYTENWSQNGDPIATPSDFCPGSYLVEVTDANNCEITQTITVNTTTLISYTISNDTILCIGDSVTLNVTGVSGVLWSNGETTNSITVSPAQSTNFTVILTENTCVVNEAVSITMNDCEFGLEFPNIFTPDGDNINEFYVPIKFVGITNQGFTIFNRWGNIMYETKENTIAWDGKADGKEASEGTYFYILNYVDGTKTSQVLHGFLQLERK